MDWGIREGDREIELLQRPDFNSLHQLNRFAHRNFRRLEITGTETIRIRRLDRVLDKCLRGLDCSSIFLKTGTQGHDLSVARGAAGVADRLNGIQAEISVNPIYEGVPTLFESLTVYDQLGFSLIAMRPFSWAEGVLVELDALFAHSRHSIPE